jgi:hypothetical protein
VGVVTSATVTGRLVGPGGTASGRGFVATVFAGTAATFVAGATEAAESVCEAMIDGGSRVTGGAGGAVNCGGGGVFVG